MAFALHAAATAVAAAAPAAVAKATIMATLKSVAFKAITNLAISAAMSALQPQVGGQSGRTFEFVIDPDGPIPFAAGRVGVAGSVIHRDTFGPDLMYYGMPFVLSGAGPITAIESFMADDYPMSFDANGGATTEPYRQELFFRSVLGHQPAPAALTTPSGLKNGATLPGWTASHKLSGKAAGLIVMAENSKGSAFPTGEIKPLIQLLGLKGWDPTLDSTYPGGSGPCRLHDPSTWVTLTCPILWALKWSLGLWEGPNGKGAPQVDHQVGGIGAKLSGIDVPAFVAASNIAKANGWTVSAYPNTDDDKHQVLEAFLQAGGAIYSQRAGKISCISRAAPRASIVTISAADTAGPLEIDTAASRIDRINTIRPRFWSPAHRWQMTAMEEVTAASYQTEDGGKRTRGIDYPFVSDAKQAGQLAALQIANTREGIAGVIPLKPHLQRIRPGDAFTITEAGFVLNGLKCLCLNTDYDPATGVVRVSFVSETDAKYPFALGQSPTPPTPQVLTPVDPRFVSPPEASDWTITPRPPAPGGGQLPGFDLTGFVSNDTATAIIVETGPTADGPWTQAYQGPPTVTNIPVDGLQPGATYFIAIQYQRNQNYSEREVFGPFTAPDLVADVMPNAPGLSQIRADIEAAFGDIFNVSERIDQTRADLDAADQNLVNAITGVDDKANQLVQLTAELEANKASVASLNAQVARIDGVEAVNATQALALVDLENGKVALSEYNTLKGEVLSARDGAPSLLGKIQSLKSVDLDLEANKASVASVDALTARTANTEADIIDLELALATETGAQAQAIQQVQAKLAFQANLQPNPTFAAGLAGYSADPNWHPGNNRLGTFAYIDQTLLPVANRVMDAVTPFAIVAPGEHLVLSGEGWIDAALDGSAGLRLQIVWRNTTNGAFVGGTPEAVFSTSGGYDARQRLFTTGAAPAPTDGTLIAAYARVYAGGPVFGSIRNLKAESGTVPTAYTDDATVKNLGASVTEHSLAIIDLENNAAIAEWQVKAVASGGRPAIIQAVSSSLGSFVAFGAEQIYFGDNTVFDDATDTLTTTVGAMSYVQGWGAPFGAEADLIQWQGASSIAMGARSKVNADFFISTTMPGIGGKKLRTSKSRDAVLSNYGLNAAGTYYLMPLTFDYAVDGATWVISLDVSHIGGGGYQSSIQIISQNLDGSDPVVLFDGVGVGADSPQGKLIDLRSVANTRNGQRQVVARFSVVAGPITLQSAKLTVFHIG